jgi:hypothetical protein
VALVQEHQVAFNSEVLMATRFATWPDRSRPLTYRGGADGVVGGVEDYSGSGTKGQKVSGGNGFVGAGTPGISGWGGKTYTHVWKVF